METKDLYKVLGVSKEASQEEIRRSYRKLARKHHPDANRDDPNAEERFKEIQHAYEILSNPEKRREYDEGPRAFFGSQGTGRPGPGGARVGDFSDLSDLFDGVGRLGDIFGRSTRTRAAPRKGEDVTVSVNLKFKDALQGVTTRVSVPVEEVCGECRGTGAAPGTAPRTCPECGGRGVRSRDQGFFALSEPCARCGGEGMIVVTRVQEHPIFKRRGDDFVVEVPVSFVEAALGAEIEVPRPGGGTVKLRLPAGTQEGKRFRVRGAGAPKARTGGGERGDLIVRVSLVVPNKLTRREREILEALAVERGEDVREELFRKVG